MKSFFFLGFILLLAIPVNAEIYSWVDDSGTYNYTEDYSRVPKKYQKKVKRREDDVPQDVKPQVLPETLTTPKQADKVDTKPAAVPGDDKELYGGKSVADWRKELDVREAELKQIEQRMVELKNQVNNSMALPTIQYNLLKKDFDNLQATYDQKYKSYAELIETARKAGLTVEIKK